MRARRSDRHGARDADGRSTWTTGLSLRWRRRPLPPAGTPPRRAGCRSPRRPSPRPHRQAPRRRAPPAAEFGLRPRAPRCRPGTGAGVPSTSTGVAPAPAGRAREERKGDGSGAFSLESWQAGGCRPARTRRGGPGGAAASQCAAAPRWPAGPGRRFRRRGAGGNGGLAGVWAIPSKAERAVTCDLSKFQRRQRHDRQRCSVL